MDNPAGFSLIALHTVPTVLLGSSATDHTPNHGPDACRQVHLGRGNGWAGSSDIFDKVDNQIQLDKLVFFLKKINPLQSSLIIIFSPKIASAKEP